MKTDHTATLENPVDEFYTGDYPTQQQQAPGLEERMRPRPDDGAERYRGYGRLKGRKALITGGDSGIGRAVAIAYAREGASVAINYLPQEQPDAESLREVIGRDGGRIELLPGDLSDEATSRRIVRQAREALQGLDILVLNAGTQTAVEEIEELSTEQLRRTFETNLYPMYWMVQEALPELPEGAVILTTSSIQAYKPSKVLLDYAASKSAIVGFSRALAQQLAPRGIRVNSVAPGPIWTPLQVTGGQLPEEIPHFGEQTPLGRAGQPAELAGIYVFLASNEASYITAQVYGVTGGEYLY